MADSQNTDPIFAAIEANRSALAAIDAAGARDASDAEMDRLGDVGYETWQKVLDTTPTTTAGVLAFMEHARDKGTQSAFLNLSEVEGTLEAWQAVERMIRAIM
jgi:hypothetical protein